MWYVYVCPSMCVYVCGYMRVGRVCLGLFGLHGDRAVKRKSKGYRLPNARLGAAVAGQFVYRARVDAAFLVDTLRVPSIASAGEAPVQHPPCPRSRQERGKLVGDRVIGHFHL